jgi:drug/metabolite transporter (DMT)-like permease
MFKASLILLWSSIAVGNQISLKSASDTLSGLPFSDNSKLWLAITVRVGAISLLSLGATIWCYRYFGFTEFLIAQTFYYIIAFGVAVYFLKEEISIQKIAAAMFISIGIGLFYAK